jgi:serine protease AprX
VALENIPDTDLNVGHGTHCAGIAGGSGQDSSGLYSGVAPGAKLIGTGSGAALFVLNALGGFEWSLAHQSQYGIRIISNSYGSTAPGFDPEDPINVASRAAHDHDMVVVFAAGNSGPGKGTLNPYAKAPWVIGVAAGTKEGGLASFSSRGLPAAERTSADYNEAPTLTAPGTGREFDPAQASISQKFTSDVISTRSITNVFANGGQADLELPLQYVPFYTQISGTSMATPFVAGVAALVLEANPSLTPDQVKDVLVRTASHMPGYEDFEAGAGYVNAYAAVDLAFHPGKAYGSYGSPTFNESFTITGPPPVAVHLDYNPAALPGPGSANSRPFTVLPGMNVLDVFAQVDTAAQSGDGNTVGLLLTDPTGAQFSSGIALPILDAPTREVVVKNPRPGAWLLEARGVRGLAALPNVSLPISGAAAPGPVDITLRQQQFVLAPVADIQGHPLRADIELALQSRYMDTFPDGTFRPDAAVTRGDLASLLSLNTALRQSLADAPPFTDVSGPSEAMAEAVTASGSTLRDWSFEPAGMMDAAAPSFSPGAGTTRLQVAVALVRALGLDPDARALAGTLVTATSNGLPIPLDDNAQIPSAQRGYVQLALNLGILQATVSPLPVPHATFNPSGAVTRARMAQALARYRAHFAAGF